MTSDKKPQRRTGISSQKIRAHNGSEFAFIPFNLIPSSGSPTIYKIESDDATFKLQIDDEPFDGDNPDNQEVYCLILDGQEAPSAIENLPREDDTNVVKGTYDAGEDEWTLEDVPIDTIDSEEPTPPDITHTVVFWIVHFGYDADQDHTDSNYLDVFVCERHIIYAYLWRE